MKGIALEEVVLNSLFHGLDQLLGDGHQKFPDKNQQNRNDHGEQDHVLHGRLRLLRPQELPRAFTCAHHESLKASAASRVHTTQDNTPF